MVDVRFHDSDDTVYDDSYESSDDSSSSDVDSAEKDYHDDSAAAITSGAANMSLRKSFRSEWQNLFKTYESIEFTVANIQFSKFIYILLGIPIPPVSTQEDRTKSYISIFISRKFYFFVE